MTISITTNNLVIDEGRTAQFNATASGINEINFVYHWRKRGNDNFPNNVSGVNGTVLTILDLSIYNQGNYYCTVTNEWGRSVESNNVTLIVEGIKNY